MSNECMRILEGELSCVKILSGSSYRDHRVGDTVRVRQPLRFEPCDIWMPTDLIREHQYPVLLDRQSWVDIDLTEMGGLSLVEASKRILEPAMAKLADGVFAYSRGAELLVNALPGQMSPLPDIPGVIHASSQRLNLRAIHYRPGPFSTDPAGKELIRFDMLYGALRSA